MKWVLKALVFVLNVVLVLATINAFFVVGQVLVGLLVVVVMTFGIGYVVTDLL